MSKHKVKKSKIELNLRLEGLGQSTTRKNSSQKNIFEELLKKT